MNNEVSVGLDGKDQLGDSGDEKRIKNPGDKRKKEKNYNRWFYLAPDYEGDVSLIHKFAAFDLLASKPFMKGVFYIPGRRYSLTLRFNVF